MVTKDAGLRIRVEHELRDKFVETCRMQDKPAAQVLREFMREYVARTQAKQARSRAGGAGKRSQSGMTPATKLSNNVGEL